MAGKKKQIKKPPINYFKAVMFFITLGLMPLIVHYVDMNPSPEEMFIMPGSTSNQDMFSYYKSWIFAICAAILGLNSLWDFFLDNPRFDYRRCLRNPFTVGFAVFFTAMLIAGIMNNLSGGGPAPSNQVVLFLIMMFVYTAIFLPLILVSAFKGVFKTHIPRPVAIAAVVFLMCVFATTAFTDYRHLTYYGAIERCEGVFVLLGYIIILVEVANFAASKRGMQIVFTALLFSAAVIGTIGFFQLLGMDIFTTDIANKIVLGEAYEAGMRLTPRFREVYSTLYNPNSVGIYSAMMGPFALVAAFLWPKNSPTKYILLATAVFAIICLFGSNSSAGLIGSIAALGVFVVLMFVNFVKNKRSLKVFACVAIAAAVVVVGLMIVPSTGSRIMLMVSKFVELPQTDAERGYFNDIEVIGDTVRIIRGDNSVSITISDEGQIIVKDRDGNIVEDDGRFPMESGIVAQYSSVPGWREFSLTARQSVVIYMEDSQFGLYIGADTGRNAYLLHRSGQPVDLSYSPPSIGFENSQFFASSRGYIWSKSLPIVINSLLIGQGVDSFIIAFPQGDLIGKARFFDNPYMMIDKAHNIYLQTAINTGVVSSLAQIALFGIFQVWAVKRLIAAPNLNTPYCATLLGATVGVVGYMVTGLSTDSLVSVAPIFWAILGLGYACIYAIDHKLD